MAVDPTAYIDTEEKRPKAAHNLFAITDDPAILAKIVFAGSNLSSIAGVTRAIDAQGDADSAKEKARRRELATAVAIQLSDTALAEIKSLSNDAWTFLMQNYTAQQILDMSDEQLNIEIKGVPELQNRFDALAAQIAEEQGITIEEAENIALEQIRVELREQAKAEVTNQLTREAQKNLELTEQGLAANILTAPENMTPENMIAELEKSIETSQTDFQRMQDVAQNITTFMEKYGTDPELQAQLDALNESIDRQSALTTFNENLKTFIETNSEDFPNLSAQDIMVRALMDDTLMKAYEKISTGMDQEKFQELAYQAAENLGLSREDAQRYMTLVDETRAATDNIRNILAKFSIGSRAVFNTSQIGTDGLDENALIFRDYNGNFVTINYRTGAETQITEDHIIAAIKTAEADPDYSGTFKVGHPNEMMELKKAFSDAFDASIKQLQQGMAQQEAIAKTAHQTETELTEIETPEMTPDEVQQFVTDNKARIFAIFAANPDGISPDMLKYGLALLGLQPGNDLNRAMSIVSNMPEANIIDPAASKEFNPVAMTAAPTTPSMS